MPSQDSSHPAPCRLLRLTDSTSTPHESSRAWLVILRLTDPRYGRGILGYGPGAHQALRQERHSCEPWDEFEGDQKDAGFQQHVLGQAFFEKRNRKQDEG